MIFERLYDQPLAQASYLIGCASTHRAIVIDPNARIEQYVALARSRGLTITDVTETHVHADFLSGARALAAETRARLHLSAEGDPRWGYEWTGNESTLRDGAAIHAGTVRLDAMHTPGHTPEHMSFLVTDTAASTEPVGIITGDFLFAGDVGRPDLLERAGGAAAGSREAGARQLFASLAKLSPFPDYLQLWPGHGAGSACGRSLAAVPSTTLGYERRTNWAFAIQDADAFVSEVLRDQPEVPRYFARMKTVNRKPRSNVVRADAPGLNVLDSGAVASAIDNGAVVIDLRPTRDFAARHIPGTINIPGSDAFLSYAGVVLPDDRDIILSAPDGASDRVATARIALGLIGLDRVVGVAAPTLFAQWSEDGRAWDETPIVASPDVSVETTIIDVRSDAEWATGRIANALHLSLGKVAADGIPLADDRSVIIVCESGTRSAIAASLLRAGGRRQVANLLGGMHAWRRAGLPVSTD